MTRSDRLADVLARLVDKSLVVREAAEPPRLRLLEPIREFAREKLEEAGERAAVVAKYLSYLSEFARRADRQLRGPAQRQARAQLDLELENLRAALAFALEAHETARGIELADALTWWWDRSGQFSEGRRWFELFLEQLPADDFKLRAIALCDAGMLAVTQGDNLAAQAQLSQAAALAPRAGDPRHAAQATWQLGIAAYCLREFDASQAFLDTSEGYWRTLGDEWGQGVVAMAYGVRAYWLEDLPQAHHQLSRALALFQRLGDRLQEGRTLMLLGNVALSQHDLPEAETIYREALALRREQGDRLGTAMALNNLGELVRARGDWREASALYADAVRMFHELGVHSDLQLGLMNWAEAEAELGHTRHAAELFYQVIELGRADLSHPYVVVAVLGLAYLLYRAQPADIETLRETVRAAAAAAHTLQRHESVLSPFELSPVTRYQAALRAALPPDEFERTWAEGRALAFEQAVEFVQRVRVRLTRQPERAIPSITTPPPTLKLFGFGRAVVQRGEREITAKEWRYSKTQELLFYLLTHPARTREQIGVVFWEDASPEQLRNNFHVTLHQLRRALGGKQWIGFEDERYHFNRLDGYWYDVETFEGHLDQAHGLAADLEPTPNRRSRTRAHLQAAVDLYRGDFVQDFVSGDWFWLKREELRRKYFNDSPSLIISSAKRFAKRALLCLSRARFPAAQALVVSTLRLAG